MALPGPAQFKLRAPGAILHVQQFKLRALSNCISGHVHTCSSSKGVRKGLQRSSEGGCEDVSREKGVAGRAWVGFGREMRART
eukprot:7598246-Alexandrium_andersonii.AAC.1